MKTCTRCGQEFPRDGFYKNRTRKDGLTDWCKECSKEATRLQHLRDPEAHRRRARAWFQANKDRCRENKRRWEASRPPESREERNRRQRERYRCDPEFRERVLARSRARLLENPDYGRAKTARRRAMLRGRPAEFINPQHIYERDGGKCHICHRRVSRGDFHIDHLIPVSQGGANVASNVALAHPFCNVSRGAGRIPAQLRLVG